MIQKHTTGQEIVSEPAFFKVAQDGYIRLTFEEFRQIHLLHLISGLDEDDLSPQQDAATLTDITGYTEWVSNTTPVVSIGWDWMIEVTLLKGGSYARISEPRSNVMIVDTHRNDFGPTKSALLIETVIDEIPWKAIVESFVKSRYSA